MAGSRATARRIQFGVAALLLPLALGLSAASASMLWTTPEVFAQHLINGLTLGALFALIALGYTMVYGIIELINFAHGEIFMVGSFLGLIVIRICFGAGITSIWIVGPAALVIAMVGCAALGVALDSVAYKPLRRRPAWSAIATAALAVVGLTLLLRGEVAGLSPGRIAGYVILCGGAYLAFQLDERSPSPPRSTPRLNALLSAIGASIFLQNLVMLTVGRDTQPFPQLGDFTGLSSTYWDIGSIRLLYIEPITLFAAIGLMIALDVFVSKTRLGKGMRATAQDPEAAMMLGIPVNRVITTTFIVGSGLAAAAGILYGLRYGGVKFNDGFIIGLKAFVAAVLGGIGNIRGAMLGGFLLGLSETIVIATMEYGWEGLGHLVGDEDWPKAEFHDYKDAIAFLILIVVLSFRPSGLLGAPDVDKV
jgi:branched-chain amino acid transport system permease protein